MIATVLFGGSVNMILERSIPDGDYYTIEDMHRLLLRFIQELPISE
jgi:hypothetical protein